MCEYQARELEVTVFWKDARNMCAIKFIRLEEYLEDKAPGGEMLALEPQGYVFAEVRAYFFIE